MKRLSYTPSRSFSRFLSLIFTPETILEKALNIGDIRGFSRIISESNLCPKNLENDREGVYKKVTLFFATPQFIQTHFFSWIAFFKQKEREIHIATHAGLAAQPGIHLHHLPVQRSCLNVLQVLREIIEIRKLLVAEHLIFFFGWRMIFFGLTSALFRSNKGNYVCVATGLGSFFRKKHVRWFFFIPLRFLCRCVRPYLWAENQEDLLFLSHSFNVPLHKQRCFPGPGVDMDHFQPKPMPSCTTLILGFCGRFIWDKGLKELIAAMALVRQRGSDVVLHLAGVLDCNNPTAVQPETIEAWKKIPWISFCGQKHYDDLPSFWAQVHAAILPSYGEGLPQMLIEAAAVGRPAITTNVSGCCAVTQHGQTGLCVPIKDTQALVQAIEICHRDLKHLTTMGENARMYVVERFSRQRVNAFLNDFLTNENK